MAELGPGHSIGVGLAALLTGSDKYFGLDQTAGMPTYRTTAFILEQLIDRYRCPRNGSWNGDEAWRSPRSDGLFVHGVAGDAASAALRPERIGAIQAILRTGHTGATIEIRYFALYPQPSSTNSLLTIISQAVLEHAGDLAYTYRAMAQIWPGGWMSHQIDFAAIPRR
ncbi:MAG: hypothetical protein U0556_13225 [Dehalococcoidia bacterium]